MIELVSDVYDFQALPVEKLWDKDDDQVLAFKRGNLIFVFNWAQALPAGTHMPGTPRRPQAGSGQRITTT